MFFFQFHFSLCKQRPLWTCIGLVLFQDNMSGELGLWYRSKLLDDVFQSLQARHPQLVAVVSGRHEGHADQVGQVEHQ